LVDRRTLRRLLIGAALALALGAVCGVLLREPLVEWGGGFIDRFGLAGLFLGTLITDSSLLPLTNEPLVLLAISGGTSPWTAFAVTSTASVLAGPLGWALGRLVARRTPLGLWLHRRYPDVAALLARRGARFVAVAALLPFPFAVSTWLAGATDVPLAPLLLASLLRVPKTAFYVALLTGGWALGG